MTNINIKNHNLNYFYKKYIDIIINFEKHIMRIFSIWIIDIHNKNYLLQQLDNILNSMTKIYNNLLKKCKNTTHNYISEDTYITYKNIYEGMNIIEYIENPKKYNINPFTEIKLQILNLAKLNGFYNLDDFFKLFINDHYNYYFDIDDMETFEIYNKVFVPLTIEIEYIQSKKKSSKKISIQKIESKYDSLIYNTCRIIINIDNINHKIIFEGYIAADVLNIYVKTSRIYSKFLFTKKNEVKTIINNNYKNIDNNFYNKYIKLINSNIYFANSANDIVENIVESYNKFINWKSINFNLLIKEFVNSNIKQMYLIICLLMMGDEQNEYMATLLFNILKDKKINADNISDIIYNNLSFYSQIKIKKFTSNIESELQRIKTLSSENITIEKQLSTLINMPDNVKTYILEKINELKTDENNYKLQTAINGLIQYPWKPKNFIDIFNDLKYNRIKITNYLNNISKKLNDAIYGHNESKEILVELMGQWITNPSSSGQIIGLVGPQGVGKTLFAKSISHALNIPLTVIGLGGMNDSADLVGHSFTYAGAQYGMIVRQMIKAGNWRCVMFFDEIDKVAKKNDTNEIFNTLIHITDKNMNKHFQDRFYSSSIEFDLSGVLMIFSYNSSEKIDPILLDRIKEIKISPYTVKEKIIIAQKYIINELCTNIQIDRNKICFDNKLIKYIIENYTLEAGVRDLYRKLEKILLKLNIDRIYIRGPFLKISNKYNISKEEHKNNIFNMKFKNNIIITKKLIHKYLEKPSLLLDKIHDTNMVGVINGLFATVSGIGGIIPIQVYKNYTNDNIKENLKLKITGNQKKIMKESVICALTTAINHLNPLIRDKIIKNFINGFHVHAPDAGTPKDGPSAGCAFAIAFLSVMLNKKINREIAITGELHLTGKVSKIGGLDIKLLGAKKAGIKRVYISEENKEDYDKFKKNNPEIFDNTFEIKIIKCLIDIAYDPYVMPEIVQDDFDPEIICKKYIDIVT